ncbi:fatty acid amide hydrolase-like [Anneissia japonica]|uniref:fatty acid amide hydrolase-like n=1 Tax=Anneissia japonica TaxID=1529436 RepID=UPI0014256107|nr:fatty acid amide hydrolase-like [Anneissia japonica]
MENYVQISIVITSTCLLMTSVWFLGIRRSKTKRRPIEERPVGEPCGRDYNIQRAVLPRASGWTLKFLTTLSNSLIGSLTSSITLSQTNMNLFQGLHLDDVPTYQPSFPFCGPPAAVNEKCTTDNLILKRRKKSRKEFTYYSVSEFHQAYLSGEVTPAEVAEDAIEAIKASEAREPKLRAIVEYNTFEIRRMAKESTDRYNEGSYLSVFDGVPIAFKNELHCVPYHRRAGSDILGREESTQDATVVAKMREAGAIIIGMTNMHEFGLGTTGCNPGKLHGTARNPYNTNHYTGGSSSGSAAAVSAGLCPVAFGTDAGGSIRIPSSFCGVVGLKATLGRISYYGGAGQCYSCLHCGPICTSVRDAALAYATVAGPDPLDQFSVHQPEVTLWNFDDTDLSSIKLGIDWRFFRDCDKDVLSACEKAVKYLEQNGAKVIDIEIPEMEETRIAHAITCMAEMKPTITKDLINNYDEIACESRVILSAVDDLKATDFILANKQRTRTIKFLREIYEKVDVIITPGTPFTAPEIQPGDLKYGLFDSNLMTGIMRYMFLGNFIGNPCLVVPVGFSQKGLPISLQIHGRWWEEDVVLRIGNVAEMACPSRPQPEVFYSLL